MCSKPSGVDCRARLALPVDAAGAGALTLSMEVASAAVPDPGQRWVSNMPLRGICSADCRWQNRSRPFKIQQRFIRVLFTWAAASAAHHACRAWDDDNGKTGTADYDNATGALRVDRFHEKGRLPADVPMPDNVTPAWVDAYSGRARQPVAECRGLPYIRGSEPAQGAACCQLRAQAPQDNVMVGCVVWLQVALQVRNRMSKWLVSRGVGLAFLSGCASVPRGSVRFRIRPAVC